MAGTEATIEKLLAPEAVDMTKFQPLAANCDHRSIPFVIGEGNSAYGGGKTGVSNVFASALWGVDLLFESVVNGIKRFNFHGGPHGSYTPIDVETNPPFAFAHPLFYAMWSFTDATANGAAVLNVDYNASNAAAVKLWATSDDHSNANTATIVAIHKRPWDMGGTGANLWLNVSAVAAPGSSVIMRKLTAPSIGSTSDVTYGGPTFDNSTTGTPHGTPASTQLQVASDGILHLFVDPLEVLVAQIRKHA